ncbi:TPA: hypothetical protein OUK43_000391 [Pseudomonas aeruginosa]|nr:hypothetical protein [Pseudomonas aeruginosa]
MQEIEPQAAGQLQVGDTVAIRGDRRLTMNSICQYLPEQLVDGKYLKHTGHGGAWTGRIDKIQGEEALVGGGWRHLSMYERYPAR